MPTAPPSSAPPAAGDAVLSRIEGALTVLVRRTRLLAVSTGVQERAGVALEPVAYAVLRRVAECGPARLSEIADRLGVDASTASRHISRLVDAGLVGRGTDPADRRASAIVLTSDGERALRLLETARREALAEVLADWDAADLDRLAADLDRLVADMERHLGRRS